MQCPNCQSSNVKHRCFRSDNHRRETLRCHDCSHYFSDTTGTIYHKSLLPKETWWRIVLLWFQGAHSDTIVNETDVNKNTPTRLLDLAAQDPDQIIRDIKNAGLIGEADEEPLRKMLLARGTRKRRVGAKKERIGGQTWPSPISTQGWGSRRC